ncbi:hypothetical protein [Ranid herpesvirus 3]|uniref:Uncharacterized protein n=1 Tax=Ranid herpesvirus 3 TaxID=1987509 RepID=A0A1X9T5J2_9VIRU|nr:hypothetical protein [Ranid herpesvirus 3]ARR28915.1 hypothetical protein [Ranid herpesvirus 3]
MATSSMSECHLSQNVQVHFNEDSDNGIELSAKISDCHEKRMNIKEFDAILKDCKDNVVSSTRRQFRDCTKIIYNVIFYKSGVLLLSGISHMDGLVSKYEYNALQISITVPNEESKQFEYYKEGSTPHIKRAIISGFLCVLLLAGLFWLD